MLALIALYIMRPPFIEIDECDPYDDAELALMRELETLAATREGTPAVTPETARYSETAGSFGRGAVEPGIAAF